MPVINTNLIRPTISGLDNMLSSSNMLDAGGMIDYNNLSASSNISRQGTTINNPASIGISNIFLNSTINKSIDKTDDMTSNLQELSKSINNQEARIAAGTGSNIATQYLEDEEKKDEGLIMKILNILDAPRNALFNGFKYMSSGIDFFEGFWKGLTREEEYTGYDLADDLGLYKGTVGNAVVGFISEVFFDPVNWIDWGASSLVKGFAQGAVKDVAKETADQVVKRGIKEIGEKASREGLEELGEGIISSGIKATGKATLKEGAEEVSEKIAVETAKKNINTGLGGIFNSLNKKLETYAEKYGLTYGNSKLQALWKKAYGEAVNTRSLAGNLTDDVLSFATKGDYGEEIQKLAQDFITNKEALAAADDAVKISLEQTIAQQQDQLLELLKPYRNEIRLNALSLKNIDEDALRQGVSTMYEDTIVGSLKSLEKEFNVDNAADLMTAMSMQAGKEITQKDLYVELVKLGFGDKTISDISDRLLKTGSVEAIRSRVLDNLIDVVAADKLYDKALNGAVKQLGTGFGFSIPFTNVRKEMETANEMYEIGAKLRTAIGYRVNDKGELVSNALGNAITKFNGGIEAIFGHLPILGEALSEANRIDRTNRWALKMIQQSTKGKAQLAAVTAENSIENYYKILKEAGFETPEEITDVGNFISSAIESRQLGKTETVDDWLKKIARFTEMDEATIKNKVGERLEELTNQFTSGQVEEQFMTNGVIDDAKFQRYYNQVKDSFTKDLQSQSELKKILFSYDDKKQRAILDVTKLMAEDFDSIGKTLADLNLIPDERMLQPEYWYYPHKMNLDLMLDNDMNYERVVNKVEGLVRTTGEAEADVKEGLVRGMRNVLGGRTEQFTLRNVSSWQRKYPMTTVEVNKILQGKYGIDHMLETNAFNTYLLYAIDQGKVIADAGEISDVLNTFGIKINNRQMVDALRAQGYTIVTRRTNIDAIQLSPKAMEGIINYNKRAEDYNKLLKKFKGVRKTFNQVQSNSGKTLKQITEQINLRQATKEQLKNIKETDKLVISKAKSIVTDANYLQDLVNKGVFPAGVDRETIEEMLDSIVNNEFARGTYLTKVDTIGNQAMPELVSTSALRNIDGTPYVFMSPNADLATGFRQVPEAVDNIRGQDFFYIISKNPTDIMVDDIGTELANAANKYTDEFKQSLIQQGYDSIRLVDSTGAVAVIPFDEANVIYRNRLKQIEYSGKYRYAKDMANTAKGDLVNPTKVFVPDQTRINVSDLTTKQRRIISKMIDRDYQSTRATIDTLQRVKDNILDSTTNGQNVYNSLTKHMKIYVDTQYGGVIDLLKLDRRQEEILNTYKNTSLPREAAREVSDIDSLMDRLAGSTSNTLTQLKSIDRRLNNIQKGRQYNFIAGLKKAKGFDSKLDAYITTEELYNMLGSSREAGLVALGYDAIVDNVVDGKVIYKALPNATVITKQQLMDGYDAIMTSISTVDEASDMVQLLTDVGTGRDALAQIVNKYANKNGIQSMESMRNRLQKIADLDANKLDDLSKLPYAKEYTEKQKRLIAKLASETGILSNITDEANTMFDIMDTMTAITREDSDIWAIPSEIVTYLNKAVNKQTNDGVKVLKNMMYKFNKIWKPSVTAWRPSFGVRNLVSGYFNSWMYAGIHIFDRDITEAAFKMATSDNLDDVVELGGKSMTLREWKNAMVERNVNSGLVSTDINGIGEILARQMKSAVDPTASNLLRHPLKTMEKLNANVEDYNRSLLFLAAAKNGETLDYAADLVRQLQFDYGDLSELEKAAKNVMPFYTWMRNNIPLQVERFMDDPTLYTLLLKRIPEMSKEASGMSDEEWDNIPDWVKETFPIVLGKDSETGRYRLFDTTLPYQDLRKLGGVQEMFGEGVSLLHPLVKTPMELFLNKNMYTGAALESYEGETAEQAIKGTANPILNAIAKVAPNAVRSMPRYYCCC